jgi:23S rRNA (pseudouridine1915-N3)-methyltransferase
MRVLILAAGKIKPGPERALYEHYAARLEPKPTLIEIEEKRPLGGAELKAREAALLRAKRPKNALLVALDERGTPLASPDFARKLGLWRDSGRDLAFLIGGADGLDPGLRAEADFLWSLGPLTWPHLLVRGLVAEQLFRAQSILKGHPYHRG